MFRPRENETHAPDEFLCKTLRRHCAKFLQAESVSLGHKCDPRGFPSLCMCIYLLLHTHVSSTDQKFQEI